MKKFRKFLRGHWRLLSIIIGIGFAVGLLLLYKLGSLTGGLSDSEIRQQVFASSWHHIANNPLNLPLTAVQWFFLTVFSHHGQTVARLGSVVFGIFSLASFAYVLRRWYGARTTIFGTVIFACSSWFLHISRFGGPEVIYLWAIPMLLAVHIAWERHRTRPLAAFIAIFVLSALLYVPGILWLVILSFTLQSHHIVDSWKQLRNWRWRSVLAVFFILLLVPLILALARTPALIQTWLGLPHTFGTPIHALRRLAQSISFLIWKGPSDAQLWLGRIAVLNIFCIIMAIAGALFYAKHILAPRTRLLLGLFIVGALLYALGGPVGYSILIPIVYFVITAGVGYILHEWLAVFPRNPLARGIGFTLLSLVIILSCTYSLRAYFVAWPHNPATPAAFHNRR